MLTRLKSLFVNRDRPQLHRSRSQFHHLELGEFERLSYHWFGSVSCGGRKVHLSLVGTETAPDAALLDSVEDMLARFDEVQRMGTEFLRSHESIGHAAMELYSIDFRSPEKPGDFSLVFSVRGDDSQQWLITFENGEPQLTRSLHN